jgi:acetyltransferase-like isoleucine patch superfamily enzyme
LYPAAPVLPRFLLPPLRLVYSLHYGLIVGFRAVKSTLYCNPVFQSRCASFGRGVSLTDLPFVSGPVELHIGNNVRISGKVSIMSGRIFDTPRFTVKNRSIIEWGTTFVVNQEIVIEEDVMIASGCRISDSDSHPREADLRAAGFPPRPEDIKPVRICRYAWLGAGSHVMKGVTIGEGAVVAANSVVITNLPPFCLAMGNPAEILLRKYGQPSTARKSAAAPVSPTSPEASSEAS